MLQIMIILHQAATQPGRRHASRHGFSLHGRGHVALGRMHVQSDLQDLGQVKIWEYSFAP